MVEVEWLVEGGWGGWEGVDEEVGSGEERDEMVGEVGCEGSEGGFVWE